MAPGSTSDAVHTNGIKSFWAILKRSRKGVYHKMSANTGGIDPA